MKLNSSPLAHGPSNAVQQQLVEHALQVNLVSEGKMAGTYNAQTAAPTSGNHALGDYIRNSNPSEAGGGGSKYVVLGWVCVLGGEPGTWLPCRVLTGN